MSALLTSRRRFQSPDGFVQRRLLGDGEIKLRLVVRHDAVTGASATEDDTDVNSRTVQVSVCVREERWRRT